MTVLVIGERRREPRRAAPLAFEPQVPGIHVLDVLDVSEHGLRCRVTGGVRPGRPMSLRLRIRTGSRLVSAHVVRCHVCRVTRQSVAYEAVWIVDRPWPG